MAKELIVPEVNTLSVLESAFEYIGHGISVVPIYPEGKENEKRYKRSPVLWRKYQKELPSVDQAIAWWGEDSPYEDYNLAIVTGQLSNIAVIDADNPEALRQLQLAIGVMPEPEENPIIKTPRGWHIYYEYTPQIKTRTTLFDIENLDGRGEGGYVIAPPSIIDGVRYRRIMKRANRHETIKSS